jgi:RNA polymerase sporulation-specific sigma factor
MNKTVEELYEKHERLIYYTAMKFIDSAKRVGLDYDDVYSACNFAFFKACNTFDESKGFKFNTYAIRTMMNECMMMIRARKSSIRIPSNQQTSEFIIQDKGMGTDIAPIYDIIQDKVTTEKILIEREKVKYILDKLKENEKQYKMYILFDAGKTQDQIGEIMGHSQSYISRLKKRMQNDVRRYIDEYDAM